MRIKNNLFTQPTGTRPLEYEWFFAEYEGEQGVFLVDNGTAYDITKPFVHMAFNESGFTNIRPVRVTTVLELGNDYTKVLPSIGEGFTARVNGDFGLFCRISSDYVWKINTDEILCRGDFDEICPMSNLEVRINEL